MVNKNKQYSFRSVKSIPRQFVKDVIKYSGYSDSDKNTNGNYHLVPGYLIQYSRAYFSDALKHKQVEEMVDLVMISNTTCLRRQKKPSEIQQLKDTIRYLQQQNEVLEGDRNTANESVVPNEDWQCELFLLGLN